MRSVFSEKTRMGSKKRYKKIHKRKKCRYLNKNNELGYSKSDFGGIMKTAFCFTEYSNKVKKERKKERNVGETMEGKETIKQQELSSFEKKAKKQKKNWILLTGLLVGIVGGISFFLGYLSGYDRGYADGYYEEQEISREEALGEYNRGYQEGYSKVTEELQIQYDTGYEEGYQKGLDEGKQQEEGNENGVAVIPASAPKSVPTGSVTSKQTVYITNTGTKYHTPGCRYLDESRIQTDLSDAKQKGYKPCRVCNP